jgi:hypothetical protein
VSAGTATTARQESPSVSSPPISEPDPDRIASTALITPTALPRSAPSNSVAAIEKPATGDAATPAPWSIRPASIGANDWLVTVSRVPAAISVPPISRINRVPRMSARRPKRATEIACAST